RSEFSCRSLADFRHAKSCEARRRYLRATEHTDWPLSKLSATIRAFSSAEKTLRLPPATGVSHHSGGKVETAATVRVVRGSTRPSHSPSPVTEATGGLKSASSAVSTGGRLL